MLSRTADHLFWMARYTERAENTARMLDVQIQNSLMPQSIASIESGWRALLNISELSTAFEQKYTTFSEDNVIEFMVKDPDNSSSITACLTKARENARAVRGTLSTESWETLNTTWLNMPQHLKGKSLTQDPKQFFEWVKYRSHLSRGVNLGTMLKDETLNFINLGTFLERADNTARILDVKFLTAQNKSDQKNQAQSDFYYWAALLRSVSAFEVYRKVYHDVITPARVAELLILRSDMPRSLLACVKEVVSNLHDVRNDLSAETERFAGRLHAKLQFDSISEILNAGMHNYLTDFLSNVGELGNRLSRDFLVPLVV